MRSTKLFLNLAVFQETLEYSVVVDLLTRKKKLEGPPWLLILNLQTMASLSSKVMYLPVRPLSLTLCSVLKMVKVFNQTCALCLLESPNFLTKYCFYTPNTRNCFSEDCTFCNIGVGWIQCLHICIWTDRDRQNLYDGRK